VKADGRQVPYSISLLHIPRNNRIAEGLFSQVSKAAHLH
jgi:hypothetical protein